VDLNLVKLLDKSAAHFCHQVSISPTFYDQLLRQNPCTKKMTNPNCKHIKAVQKLSYEKAARKILVKLTPGVSMDCERAKGKSKSKEQN
jgi:hypothetical protein